MILAGIDEAGYGPLLGPLVVGCCAFELADADPFAPLPCLWKRLRKHISKNRSKTGRKLHVNDSKQVYSPSTGLKELERSVLSLLTTLRGGAAALDPLLAHLAPHAVNDVAGYAWYAAIPDEVFPI